MKHVIIGTAGHVDHGKTALIKALTGIDTDRLDEEKRRGITIELGFAYLDFEDGTRVGIIDVPGHERFIHNMLAGSGGIDLAMLVVAADEGVMPQTREHLSILTQLGIGNGIVVITKVDKVEPDWLELVAEDVTALVKDTFLAGKPLLPASAYTGEGLAELKQTLYGMVGQVQEKDSQLPFRLPVDRVFNVDGFGTVVTGTLIEGAVSVGDVTEILPAGGKASIRSIQVHGESVDTAFAGQRTAVSLAGVKSGNVKRGDVVAAQGMVNVTTAIDVKLNASPDTQRTIKSGSELHLYHGARSLLARVALLDRDVLKSAESCYARFRLEEPLPCKRGDRFVVRFYSPLETLGGGTILDSSPVKRIARIKSQLETLSIREKGDATEIANLAASELDSVFSLGDLCRRADLVEKDALLALDKLITGGSVLELLPGRYISAVLLTILSDKCMSLLKQYHSNYPLRSGMNIAELRQKLLPDAGITDANAVVYALRDCGAIRVSENGLSLPDFSVQLSSKQSEIYNKLIEEFSSAGFDTPSPDEIALLFKKSDRAEVGQVMEFLEYNGELIALSSQVLWRKEFFDDALGRLRVFCGGNGEITLAECRDLLGTSRKYALAFLEYLDGKQITTKIGDARMLVRD